jgi:hypothetical protein
MAYENVRETHYIFFIGRVCFPPFGLCVCILLIRKGLPMCGLDLLHSLASVPLCSADW